MIIDSPIRKLAGEALAMLSSKSKSNTAIILKVNDNVVHNQTKILLDVEKKTHTNRISAAEILEQLCNHYTMDDERLTKLKKAMTKMML